MLRAYSGQTYQKLFSLSLTILLTLILPIYFSSGLKEVAMPSASLSTPDPLVIPKPTKTSEGYNSGSQNRRRLSKVHDTLPLSFEANQGQAQPQVKFISRGRGYNLLLTSTEAILSLNDTSKFKAPQHLPNKRDDRAKPRVLRMKLEGADNGSLITGLDESEGKVNYFVGNKAEHWQTNVALFRKVQYRNVYPGIDLIYYGNESQIEHDFVIAPGADHHLIQLSFEGAESMRLDSQQNLLFRINESHLRLTKPVIYQIIDGRKKEVSGSYVLHKRHRVSFEVGSYNRTIPLVIDPVLVYSTYLGGDGMDEGNDIAVDRFGNAYVTGWTQSANFPPATSTTAPQELIGGFYDAFVSKLSADGQTLLYRTFLGGSDLEHGLGIAVDTAGNAYITGWTSSTNFPVVNPLQRTYAGGGARGRRS